MRSLSLAKQALGGVVLATVVAAGCSVTVDGKAGADPAAVANVKAARVESATRAACDEVDAAAEDWLVAKRATNAAAESGTWAWADLADELATEYAAGDQAVNDMNAALVTGIEPTVLQAGHTLSTALADYLTAKRSDQQNALTEASTWAKSNPALTTLSAARDAFDVVCL